MPAVEYEEYALPAVSVPATLDGVRYALPNLRYDVNGQEYIFVEGHNGSNVRIVVLDATGRRWPVQSGQPFSFDLETGVTYLAVEPDGGNIADDEVTVIATVRRPKYA